jgi:integrase
VKRGVTPVFLLIPEGERTRIVAIHAAFANDTVFRRLARDLNKRGPKVFEHPRAANQVAFRGGNMAALDVTQTSPVKLARKPKSRRAADGVYTVPGRSGFRISYVDARGRRRRHKVAAQTLGEARKIRAALASRAELDRAMGIVPASSITLADLLLKRYKAHQKAHLSASTFARIDSTINNLLAGFPALAKDVRRSDVDAHIGRRTAAGAAAATIVREIGTLGHAFKLAIEWELLVTNPAAGVKLPKLPPGKTGFLAEQEYRRVLAAAPEWMKPLITLAVFTGIRRSELLGLKWSDVNLPARQIVLRLTKNGESRAVWLNDAPLEVLANLPRTSELCFPGIAPGQLSNGFRRLLQRLGLKGLSWHSLRHTHASWLVQNGADLFGVSQLLGHKSLKMTQRYAHLAPAYLASTSSRLNGITANHAEAA